MAFAALACGAPEPPSPTESWDGLSRATPTWEDLQESPAYAAAERAVLEATRTLKATLSRRDAAEARVARFPSAVSCAELGAHGQKLDLAWSALSAAYADLEAVTATPGSERDIIGEEQALDQRHHQAWRAVCEQLPPVGPRLAPVPASLESLGTDLRGFGRLLALSGVSPERVSAPHGGLMVARRLSASLADELDVLFVLVEEGLTDDQARLASAAFERGLTGLGAKAAYDPAHLPRWKKLKGVVVLDGRAGLRRAPSLRGLLAIFGNRLNWPGCSPQFGDAWGYSDAGGQLGGGPLIELEPGHYKPLKPFGLVGNRGNQTPYCSLERYLLGLSPLTEVEPVTLLRDAQPQADGTLKAAGVCVLDEETLAARFGRRPLRLKPDAPVHLKVGVVVVSAKPLSAAALSRHRADAKAFTNPGPDDDPFLLNYFEATEGRDYLDLVRPAVLP